MNPINCVEKKLCVQFGPSQGKYGGILVGVNNHMLDVVQVEIGLYFVRILVFDKIAKLQWNFIIVYEDA